MHREVMQSKSRLKATRNENVSANALSELQKLCTAKLWLGFEKVQKRASVHRSRARKQQFFHAKHDRKCSNSFGYWEGQQRRRDHRSISEELFRILRKLFDENRDSRSQDLCKWETKEKGKKNVLTTTTKQRMRPANFKCYHFHCFVRSKTNETCVKQRQWHENKFKVGWKSARTRNSTRREIKSHRMKMESISENKKRGKIDSKQSTINGKEEEKKTS